MHEASNIDLLSIFKSCAKPYALKMLQICTAGVEKVSNWFPKAWEKLREEWGGSAVGDVAKKHPFCQPLLLAVSSSGACSLWRRHC